MADILLIFPRLQAKTSKMATNFPPLNLMFLASTLEEAGYKVDLVDCRLVEDYMDQVRAGVQARPLLAGITCMTGYQIISALQLAQLIRQINPQLPIVWGGIHPSLLSRQTVKHSLVDIIVKNEGELTLLELADALRNNRPLKQIRGIVYKDNGQIIENPARERVNMDQLPMPAWHLIKNNIRRYIQDGCIRLHSSRGCPHKCSFCYNKGYNLGHTSAMSSKKVCDEIEYLMKEFGVRKFHFVDDNFLTKHRRAVEFCEEIKLRKLNINWGFSIRIDYIREPLIGTLAEAGVDDCFIGVESGSQNILDKINKGIKVEDIKAANLLLKKHNIMGRYSFMVGFPFEKYQDVAETVQLAVELHDAYPHTEFNFNNYTPYPGTELYDLIKNMPNFKEPTSLEAWGNYQWTNIKDFKPNTNYSFEEVLLMWSLNFTDLQKFSILIRPLILALKKWSHFRLKRGYLQHTPEFRLLKLMGKLFSPF
jgi:anaerobic magnesium-protoporphyrin IX monomethyl ester cyclase